MKAKSVPPAPTSPHRAATRVTTLVWSALLAIWGSFMWSEWTHNPDLSHGIVAPFLAAFLLYEARTQGPFRYLPASRATFLGALACSLAGVAALTLAGLLAAALAWSNALVGFLLGGALSLLLVGTLILAATERWRALPFNWASFLAAGLWVFTAPIPPGTYSRVTLTLQNLVTSVVLATLHLLGIPAQQRGTIIELARTTVGVEEACSGVRSLLSCIVVALFFSALLLRSPRRRFALIAASIPLALGMNLVRSLTLTLLAHRGVNIAGLWHDLTGFAVLGVTALALVLIARALEPATAKPGAPSTDRTAIDDPEIISWPVGLALLSAIGAAVIVGFFFSATRPGPVRPAPAPALATLLPETAPGWIVDTSRDLYRFSATLRTEHLVQRTYLKRTDHGLLQLTVYVAYWRPGQAPVSLVASHTPDACWPGAGWIADPEMSARPTLTTPRHLPVAEYRRFTRHDRPQHVWFWHLYRGQPVGEVEAFSVTAMLRLVLQYGIRSEGEQAFIRISSNQAWDTFAHEPLFEDLTQRLQAIGL